MDTWYKITNAVLVVGLCGILLGVAERVQADDANEWDLLLEGKAKVGKAPARAQGRGPAAGVCPVDGGKCKAHEGKCPAEGCKLRDKGAAGMGQKLGEGPHGRDGKGKKGQRGLRGGRSGRREERRKVDPDELIDFLEEYEPELAEKLEDVRNDSPDEFRRRVPVVGKLYGHLIEEMKYDPTMTKLEVKAIRLRLRAKAAVDVIKEGKDGEQQLTEAVEGLFDTIMAQGELKYNRLKERLDERAAAKKDAESGTESKRWHRRNEDDVRKGFTERLEKHKDRLDAWRSSRDEIIKQRIDELRRDSKPFPWGR